MSAPSGIVERRVVRSASSADTEYPMVMGLGKRWSHEDAGCPSWQIRGRCRHVDELNEEPRGQLVTLPEGGDYLEKLEELDTQAVVDAVKGRVSEACVYHFEQRNGSDIWGLSIVGVQLATREMAVRGEALREIDTRIVHEDEREARFVTKAGRYAVNGDGREVLLDTAIRAKRQPKYIKLRDGGEKFNEHWYEVGTSKSVRNAFAALIADEVREEIIARAKLLEGEAKAATKKQPKTNGNGEPQAAKGPREVLLKSHRTCERCEFVIPPKSTALYLGVEKGEHRYAHKGACPTTLEGDPEAAADEPPPESFEGDPEAAEPGNREHPGIGAK